MNTIDSTQPNPNRTERVLSDTFLTSPDVVDASQYELVLSYFMSQCSEVSIARNFASFLFRISANSNIPVLQLLEQLKGTDSQLEMNAVMAYYMNSLKSRTTMYGVSNIPKPNQIVQRNVVL